MTASDHRPRCYGYSRVSRPRKDAEIESIGVHKQLCKRYWKYRLKPQGLPWNGFFGESGMSGDTRLRNRPQGKVLWERARRGDHIIIAKLDRGFRNVADFHGSLAVLTRRGVTLHFVDVNVDTSTYVGELLLGVLALIGQFERRRAGERMKDAHAQRKALGKPRGPYADYGFKWVGNKGHKRMVVDEYEMTVLAAIHECRLAGMSFEKIHTELKVKGFTYTSIKKGGEQKEWCLTRIKMAWYRYRQMIAEGRVQHRGTTTPSSTTAPDSAEPSAATDSPSTPSTTSCSSPSPDPEPSSKDSGPA